jgi:addiction module RelB/DinJ family antitoxin
MEGVMATTNINVRVDSDIKAQSQSLFENLGLDMTTAINMFLRQALKNRAIPFEISEEPANSGAWNNSRMKEKSIQKAQAFADSLAKKVHPKPISEAEKEKRLAFLREFAGLTADNPVSIEEARAERLERQ